MSDIVVVTPRRRVAGALSECTSERLNLRNVMAGNQQEDDFSSALKCPSTPSSQMNESGFVTDSAHSTPMKTTPVKETPVRRNNPYDANVLGTPGSLGPLYPTPRFMTIRQDAAPVSPVPFVDASQLSCGAPNYNAFGFSAPTSFSFPASPAQPSSPVAPSNRPTPTSRKSGAFPQGNAASRSSPASPTKPTIGRIYRNGRPVPVLPNGEPMFPQSANDE